MNETQDPPKPVTVEGFDCADRSEALRSQLEGLGPDVHIAILTQDNPDPDAIGAGLGLQRLCKALRPDLTTRIYHGGHISHPQNLQLVELLGISLLEIDKFEAIEGSRFVMLVDATNTGSKNIQSTRVPPDAVFDHHQDTPPDATPFVDIREVGATCTLITEHLVHLQVKIGPNLATALFFGLQNDTGNFGRAMSDTDWAAMRYLQPKAQADLLDEIHNFPIPNYLFELEQMARENKKQKGTLLVSGLGPLPASQRDGIPFIADKLMRSSGVDAVLVHAIVGDRIHASVRTRDDRIDANEYIQRVFEPRYAGAKKGSGGAQVPIGFLAPGEDLDNDTRKLFVRYVNDFVARRAFAAFPNGSS